MTLSAQSANTADVSARTRRHVVQQLDFDVAFPSEEHAFQWQERLEDFLRTAGRDVLREVFDELSAGEDVIAFDRIEIDLGELADGESAALWRDRLGHRLRDTLQRELAQRHAIGGIGGVGGDRGSAAVTPRRKSEWEALTRYLADGRLSWRHDSGQLTALIARLLSGDGPRRLAAWLHGRTQPQDALLRLMPHLDERQCGSLLTALSPQFAHTSSPDAALALLTPLLQANGAPPNGETARKRWRLILAALLRTGPNADKMTQAAAVAAALADSGVPIERLDALSSAPSLPLRRALEWERLRQRLTAALHAADATTLAAVWPALLRLSPRRLRALFRALGPHAESRRRIAHLFSPAMLLQLVALYLPTESDFIAFVIRRTEETAVREAGGEPSAIRARLWDFTLAQLLVDRGSAFNRRSYAAGLLQATALREGVEYWDLLQSMLLALRTEAAATGLRRQLLQLLGELQTLAREDRAAVEDAHRQQAARTHAEQAARTLRARFSAALTAPDTAALYELMPQLDASHQPWMRLDLLQHGQSSALRQRLASTLAEHALAALADCLAPREGAFIAASIHLVAAAPAMAHDAPVGMEEKQSRQTLWEFTLAYLVADRGSAFNRRSYLHGVLAQMAQRTALRTADLLNAMRLSLTRLRHPGHLQRQMLAVIEELWTQAGADAAVAHSEPSNVSRTAAALRLHLSTALAQPGDAVWERIWTDWAVRTPQLVRDAMRQLVGTPTARERLIASLPAKWRPALLHLLLPDDAGFIVQVTQLAARATGAEAAMQTAADRRQALDALWECSLQFALQAHSSGFNRRAYTAFVLHKLAARDGIAYTALLRRIVELLQAAPVAERAPDGLLHILLELSHTDETPLAPRRPAEDIHTGPGLDAHANAESDHSATPAADSMSLTFAELVMALMRHADAARATASSTAAEAAALAALAAWLDGHAAAFSAAIAHLLADPVAVWAAAVSSAWRARLRRTDATWQTGTLRWHELARWLCEHGRAETLSGMLSAAHCALLLQRLFPADYRTAIALADAIADRCRTQFAAEAGAWLDTEKWRILFRAFFATDGWQTASPLFSARDFARRFAAYLAAHERLPRRADTLTLLLAGTPADPAAAPNASAAPVTNPLAKQSPPRAPTRTDTPEAAPPQDADTDDDTEPIYIGNAGLVLLSPYLPLLCDRVGLMREGRFVDEAARMRAVVVTQALTGGPAPILEADLALNKLLCGLPLTTAIDTETALTAPETAAVEELLQAVIAHWRALGNTSVAGLRESFLRREGCLTRQGEDWRLLVESRAYDMLLDRLPWGFSTIKYSWMPGVIRVDWR